MGNKISTALGNIIKCATGILLHVQTAITMCKLIIITVNTLEEVWNLILNIRAVISDAIDAKSLKNSHVFVYEVKIFLMILKVKYLRKC